MTEDSIRSSIELTSAQIRLSKSPELVYLLYAIMVRRIDLLDQILATPYRGTPLQVATLQSWDTFDQLIEWRLRDEDIW